MRLISLNTFGGRVLKPLLEWIISEAPTTDIFCFQEILDASSIVENGLGWRSNLFTEIGSALPDFNGYFKPVREQLFERNNNEDIVAFGKATFVKKTYDVTRVGDIFIYGEPGDYVVGDQMPKPNSLLYTEVVVNGVALMICNVHGLPFPGDKLDTPERLRQSEIIVNFASDLSGEKIICGDFNLLPETESVKMFERAGYTNLIKYFGIATTRGKLCKILHPEFTNRQEFADYVFASAGVSAKSFSVPDVPISDHLPMILNFDL